MANTVRVKFAMEFELPAKMSSGDRKKIARLVESVRYLNSLSELPDGVTGDMHHFADATDAIETLANMARRARAVEEK